MLGRLSMFSILGGFVLVRSGAKVRKSYEPGNFLQDEYLLAKIGFDTTKYEPPKLVFLYFLSPRMLKYDTTNVIYIVIL